jgi:beta-lactamase class A
MCALSTSRALPKRLNSAARAIGGTVGLAVEDLNTGWTWFRHADTPFPAASVIKLPVLVAFFQEVAAGRIRADEEIVVDPRDPSIVDESGGSGVLSNLSRGRSWRLDDLAVLMMIVSDNLAANLLIDRLTPAVINAHMAECGLSITRVDCKIQVWARLRDGAHNLTTPREMHRLLKLIWEHQVPSSDRIIAVLKANQFDTRIPFQLDPDLEIAHKTGTLRSVVHDVGIVYAPGRPFIFTALTMHQTENRRAGLGIARLARLAYDGLTKSAA